MSTSRLQLRWLMLAAAVLFVLPSCGSDSTTEPTTGSIDVTTSTTGDNLDPDGYTVQVDASDVGSIGVNETKTFSGLDDGSRVISLSGVAGNCTVQNNVQSVTVPAGGSVDVSFDVECTSTTGSSEVTTVTTGDDLDADGYTLEVNGSVVGSIGANETKTFSGLADGTHTFSLVNVAANCTVQDNDQSVVVPAGGTVEVTFNVDCVPNTGSVDVTTTTTGDDFDPDGYTVEVDGTGVGSIDVNESKTFSQIAQGSHTISLSGVASNCTVQNNDQSVNVPFDGTVAVSFDVECVSDPGELEVQTSTTGVQQDSEYEIVVDGGTPQVVSPNGSVIFSSLSPGDHTVELTDLAANCSTAGANPRTVSIPAGGSTSTLFEVSCVAFGNDILFESQRDGNWEIYVMESDGTLQTNLTRSSSDDRLPVWSPDRNKIAFESNREGSLDIWIMDADGTNPVNLTPSQTGTKFVADWSPDGTRIAYTRRDPSTSQFDIWVMNADGSNKTQITNLPSDDQQARWSPDGTKFAFRTDRDGDTEIYVMDVDGSNPQNLTNSPTTNDGLPTWSPDGTKIAWTRHLDPAGADNEEIFIMDADGMNAMNLTNHAARDGHPSFSPDGSQIAFWSSRGSSPDVWVMDVDGTNPANLSSQASPNRGPAWRAP